jgi:beta-glucanase (GH16 family)
MRKVQACPPFHQGRNFLYGVMLLLSLTLTSCQPATASKVQTLAPPPTLPLETPEAFPTTQPSTTPDPISTATTSTTATTDTTPTTTAATATDTTTVGNPVGQTGNWTPIFHDEFDGSTLDASKWNTCYFNFTVGNGCDHDQGELELYQPNEVSVNNGVLTLQADKQTLTASNGKTYNYTSGMISTGPASGGTSSKFTFTYGYMEIRAKVPAGQGLWPAFWTLPEDLTWPPEIDVFEILGSAPKVITMHYHYPTASNGDGSSGSTWNGPDFSAGWHTYAVDWEPGSLTWYVDGVARQQYTNANVASKPMYLLANLAVGGTWPGAPNASTTFPSTFQIDYIRVWQK